MKKVIKEIVEFGGDISIETRKELSLKAFEYTASYDTDYKFKIKKPKKWRKQSFPII